MVPANPELTAPATSRSTITESARFLDHTRRRIGLAIAAAVVAGGASWIVGESILNAYRAELVPQLKIVVSAEDARRFTAARVASAAFTAAAMGSLLGLALGAISGLARRARTGAAAAFLGLVLGIAAPMGVAWVALPLFFKQYDPQSHDLVLPLVTHGVIWSTVGAVAGLSFGFGIGGRGRWIQTLVGGLAGAALATLIYEIVGAIAFPTGRTELPVSSSVATRLLSHLLVAVLAATGAVLAVQHSAKSPNASTPPP